MTVNPKAYVCIMAGGSGERFWPMSRQVTPKHLLKLFSDRTLVEETVRRLDGVVPVQNIFVLTNQVQLAGTRAALSFLPPEQIIAEPAKRDTAPAAALATGLVHSRDPKGVLALLPADSLIKDAATFARQLSGALARAEGDDTLLTFAIKPTHPATGFGYLEMAETLPGGYRKVARFVEKPDLDTAEIYLAGGNHAWNAGMFIWRTAAFLAEARRQVPALAKFVEDFPRGDPSAYLAGHFATLPKISVDYAIMENATAVATQLAEFDWDDVGSWTALPAHLPLDDQGNTQRGTVVMQDASNNIAISGGRLIALCGVQDLVVVETPDAVLVCHRDAVQNIKKLIPQLPPAVL
ncbi:MAG: NTP transferase domain-containing protein [Cephaloticoccus sp.]|nr:NTP transferase domain-containing protein [Cephaloticoccus sp.]MCF7760418.1 NTP transferase domain-containing protein [Cephaloticoccus sp.]